MHDDPERWDPDHSPLSWLPGETSETERWEQWRPPRAGHRFLGGAARRVGQWSDRLHNRVRLSALLDSFAYRLERWAER
jgi:hypothetical protein